MTQAIVSMIRFLSELTLLKDCTLNEIMPIISQIQLQIQTYEHFLDRVPCFDIEQKQLQQVKSNLDLLYGNFI